MRDERKRALFVWGALVVTGFVGGYYLGFVPTQFISQAGDAAGDLLVPADDFRGQRLRREAIRSELQRVTDFQVRFRAETGDYAPTEAIPVGPEGFVLSASWSPLFSYSWMGEVRHTASPNGEVCAVALGTEPAYLAGIPLKRAGRIRCSWDLATRINRML